MTAEVLRTFEEPVSAPNGSRYTARICGRPTEQGPWEGWIEFAPEAGAPILRSQRETTQSDRRNLDRWAQGLRRIYLEGSLARTLTLETPRRTLRSRLPERPHFESPAPTDSARRPLAPDQAVVNPFVVYRRGEAALRAELDSLSTAELRVLVRAYHLDTPRGLDARSLSRSDLVELVVHEVRDRTTP